MPSVLGIAILLVSAAVLSTSLPSPIIIRQRYERSDNGEIPKDLLQSIPAGTPDDVKNNATFGELTRQETSNVQLPAFLQNITTEQRNEICNKSEEKEGEKMEHEKHEAVIHLASWNFKRVGNLLVVSLILLLVGLVNVAFHYAKCLSDIVPESCLLIVFGIVIGYLIHLDGDAADIRLEPDFFMLVLLPPIILDSAFSLNDRTVLDNITTILLYAVMGTIINFFIIGPALYGLSLVGLMGNLQISLTECLLFASFIVAVDPVAVLAIFQSVGVNDRLYFLVFGESLLNDAVTVVLYNMMIAFNGMEVIGPVQVVLGVASFFTVSCGAITIGAMWGILSALITRLTTGVRVVEPLAVLVIAYLSYISAELFHWSGIISLITCGILQAEYTTQNISRKSNTTVKYFVKMLSTVSDCMIFVFLGLEVVRTKHLWHTAFVFWALLLILVGRVISVFGLTALVNCGSQTAPIGAREQFMMWYGGLRGAVCFALCATLNEDFPFRKMFLTTTLIIIFFTVFIQGITMKPLVNLCKIEKQIEKKLAVAVELHCHTTDHVMAGVERIVGGVSDSYLRTWINTVNDKYLRKLLQNNPVTNDERILQVYQKVALKDHARHIYEAIEKKVNVGQSIDNIDISDDHDIIPDKMAPQDINEKQVITQTSTDDDSLANNMRWAVARSAAFQSRNSHRDRNLTTDDEDSLSKALEEKHARMERNKRVRNPRMSTVWAAAQRLKESGKASPYNALENSPTNTSPSKSEGDVGQCNGKEGGSTPSANGTIRPDTDNDTAQLRQRPSAMPNVPDEITEM